MYWVILIKLVLPSGVYEFKEGRATIYWPKDGHSGKFKANGKRFKVEDAHIAHRRLPLGTRGIICNNRSKRCVTTVVHDRGPYGAIISCSKHVGKPAVYVAYNGKRFEARKINWKKSCVWWQAQPGKLIVGWSRRGNFDITRSVAKGIRHRPFDKVIFLYMKKRTPQI